ncbi:MAG: sigma 54-interacting transcriptional regulator [Candidatus Sungbacteria bacterium]|uniref:Sigma 54-interacting transcriptional regulator n=1 Tax=Candidatus Sungiibacteriota bacterium TaxID=2750080 RepID=A0A932QZV6_9BACT|nr:sigma 54-interacting transcriptional regulator [Candidatus Sungbacteria bacterium]
MVEKGTGVAMQESPTGADPHSPIVGKSAAIRSAIDDARRYARVPASVLITGESGTGKELFARFIHEVSPRSSRPFVAVNSAALPDTLIESELFGHERGAFTGADRQKIGLWEAADGGSLFLDEVGDLSLIGQTKILRAIESRGIRRVGGTQDIPVDIRLITATNMDLAKKIQEGTFRSDLYYRLCVLPLAIPALRERREDIPLLLANVFERLSREWGRESPPRVTPAALARLVFHSWPGNVRELENIAAHALSLSFDALVLDADAFPPEISGAMDRPMIQWRGDTLCISVKDRPVQPIRTTLDNVEREIVHDALIRCQWHRGRAAALLKVHRNTVDEKIRRHNLRQSPDSG